MFLKYLELLVIGLGIAFLVTQIAIPALRGGRLFPLFRRRGQLEQRLADAVQRRDDERLAAKIRKAERN